MTDSPAGKSGPYQLPSRLFSRRTPKRPKPRRFEDLPKGAWKRIAKRTFDQFRADGVTNLAAALTYRAVLSLFPGLLALIALLGVVGQYPATYNAVLHIISRIAPPATVQEFSGPLQEVIKHKGGAGALLGVGLAGAVWAASGYVGTFSWATNVIWEAKRGRSWYRQWPFNIGVTLVALVLLTFLLVALVVSGPLASSLSSEIGLGTTGASVWEIAKWPAIILAAALLIGGLYYIAPNVRQPPPRWLTPGAVLAIFSWVLSSYAFTIYVSNFGSYNNTYGTLGAIITFLVWVWVSNIAILVGVEFDSEIERERQLAAGLPSEEHIELPLRQK